MNKTALERRVEELEQKVFVDDENQPQGIFYICIDARKGAPPIEEQEKKPVKGWFFLHGKEEIRIVRRNGETDEELSKRAIAEAKPLLRHPLAVPVFHPIMDEIDG